MACDGWEGARRERPLRARHRELEGFIRSFDPEVRDVGRQLHVHVKLSSPCRQDQTVDFSSGVSRGEHRLRDRDFGEGAIEMPFSRSASVWCIRSPRWTALAGMEPQMQITGTCSLDAPAMPVIALSALTPLVTTTAARPLMRAYPSAAQDAFSSLQFPIQAGSPRSSGCFINSRL